MNPYSTTSRKRRGVIIIGVCLLLLAGFGVAYLLYRNTRKPTRLINGSVVQVIGNAIAVRDVGKDGIISGDDVLRSYIVTDSTEVKIATDDGTFQLATADALRSIGSLVVIRSARLNPAGFEEIVAADVIYLPPRAIQ